MWYVPEKFNIKEKIACLRALVYVLHINGEHNKIKREYMEWQISAMGIPENKYEENKTPCDYATLVKTLKGLESLRIQRYIVREMIMLAVSGHDISDDEIRSIYQIAETIGVSTEKVGDFFIWAAKGIEWRLEGIQLIEEDL